MYRFAIQVNSAGIPGINLAKMTFYTLTIWLYLVIIHEGEYVPVQKVTTLLKKRQTRFMNNFALIGDNQKTSQPETQRRAVLWCCLMPSVKGNRCVLVLSRNKRCVKMAHNSLMHFNSLLHFCQCVAVMLHWNVICPFKALWHIRSVVISRVLEIGPFFLQNTL